MRCPSLGGLPLKPAPNTTSNRGRTITAASWAIALLSLGTGFIMKEPVLILIGIFSVFVLSWFLLSLCALTQLYTKKVKSLACTITPEDAPAGTPIQFQLWPPGATSLFHVKLPGIVYRYELTLRSADEKIIGVAIPISPSSATKNIPPFTIQTSTASRGLYFAEFSQVSLYDIFGFYHFSIPIQFKKTEALILRPRPAKNGIRLLFHSGGVTHREEQTYQRTEELTEHRPYLPGDDPRRINWKLFGHSGDLFIRQGEQEPPPMAEYVLALDTSVDYSIFSQEEGRLLVDGLCQYALAIALELSRHHYTINLCFPGHDLYSSEEVNLSKILAYPAAQDMNTHKAFPALPSTASLLILAIPRSLPSRGSALKELLERHPAHRELQFIDPAKVLTTNRFQNLYLASQRYYGQSYGT